MRLALYVGKRLMFVPVAILIVVSVAFAIVNVVPSDPAAEISGGLVGEKELAEIRHELGIDRSIGDRYRSYVAGLVRGDLGRSFYSKRPITDEIRDFLPNTLELLAMGLAVATLYGITLGAIAAYYRNGIADRFARFLITTTQSVPDFFLALLLIYIFFFVFGWAPAPVGRLSLIDPIPEPVTGALLLDTILTGDWGLFRSALAHSALPVLTLGLYYSAYFAKTTRSVLVPAFASNQVEFARACGLTERKVIGYALRQARTPILTYGTILFASSIAGVAIVETIFSWGGLGQWAITAILKLDVPAMQGFVLVTGLVILLVFFFLDLLVAFLDPRVSYE